VSQDSHAKRQREMARQGRAAEKRQRRETRRSSEADADRVPEDELMERFRLLNEAHAAGAVDSASFKLQRSAIFAELGLADPDD
jgi:hypothetical protein